MHNGTGWDRRLHIGTLGRLVGCTTNNMSLDELSNYGLPPIDSDTRETQDVDACDESWMIV